MAHLGVFCPSVPYIFHDVWFRGAHGVHVGRSKGWLLLPDVAGNRATEHCSAPSSGLSPLADTDGVVTGATNLACYMQDPDFGYQDFARRDEDQTQVFRVQVRTALLGSSTSYPFSFPFFMADLPMQTAPAPLGFGRRRWLLSPRVDDFFSHGPHGGKDQNHSKAS